MDKKDFQKNKLLKLEKQISLDINDTMYPKKPWVKSHFYHNKKVIDVLIVGGGQNGVALAFRLLREGVTNIKIIDQSPSHNEGPWNGFARMRTLRSPKYVVGIDCGYPNLTIKAWWEAKYGKKSWRQLDKIPRIRWHEYIQWFKDMVGVKVENEIKLTDVIPISSSLFKVIIYNKHILTKLYVRNIVFTNGIEGCGKWNIPDMYKNLPPQYYAHSSSLIRFNELKGKNIAVIGGGASAFDNAAEALENGALNVTMFIRRKSLPTINPHQWMEFSGFMRHYGDLVDKQKWLLMNLFFSFSQPPTQDGYDRCLVFKNFSYYTDCNINNVFYDDSQISIETNFFIKKFDFVILATGFVVDVNSVMELSRFHHLISTWYDHLPSSEADHYQLKSFPYLSDSFQLTEKNIGSCPILKHIFCYNFGAMLSLSANASISTLKFGIDRLCRGITKQLFIDDFEYYYTELSSFDSNEFRVPDRGFVNPPPLGGG